MSKNHFYEKKGPFPLQEIIKIIGYTGNFPNKNNYEIHDLVSINKASKNDMTFLNSTKYKDLSLKTKAVACITTPNLSEFLPDKCIKLNVKNVLFAVTQAARMFYPKADLDYPDENLLSLDKIKKMYPKVRSGKNVLIGKNVTIGKNSHIGSNSIIESNVVIGDNCIVGSFVTIRNSLISNDVFIQDLLNLKKGNLLNINELRENINKAYNLDLFDSRSQHHGSAISSCRNRVRPFRLDYCTH